MTEPRWAIIGFGEVGSTFAGQLSRQVAGEVAVCDPILLREERPAFLSARLQGVRLHVAPTIADLVALSDLVLSTVTVTVASRVAAEAARVWRDGLFIDFNSTEPAVKKELAAAFPRETYVDGSILGAIKGEGAATPLAVSGPRAEAAAQALKSCGFRARVAGDQVGAASALKLCRSIFMKGIECLFVETLLAAREYGLEGPVLDSIEETIRTHGVKPLAELLVTTHAVHCERRSQEMVGAVAMLLEMGMPSYMSEASRSFLLASSQAGLPQHFREGAPGSLEDVLEVLARHYKEKRSA